MMKYDGSISTDGSHSSDPGFHQRPGYEVVGIALVGIAPVK